MPNYVKNILSFDGDPAQVDRLFSAIQGKNGPMDFNKLIPMPSELEIESGSRTAAGFKEYMGFLAETGFHTELEANYLAAHPEIDREEWDLGKQAFHNIREFGCPTWYEWRIQNWGHQVECQRCGSLGWPAFLSDSLERAETDSGKAVTDVPLHHDPSCLGR